MRSQKKERIRASKLREIKCGDKAALPEQQSFTDRENPEFLKILTAHRSESSEQRYWCPRHLKEIGRRPVS